MRREKDLVGRRKRGRWNICDMKAERGYCREEGDQRKTAGKQGRREREEVCKKKGCMKMP